MPIPASAFISDPDELAAQVHCPAHVIRAVHARYPLRVSRHFLALALEAGAPLLRQIIPHPLELADEHSPADPLNEENLSPVPGLIHRYPDRAVLLACLDCASYCRFCTRKRRVGQADASDAPVLTPSRLEAALAYLRATPAVADVLISGGDPLMLADEALERLVSGVRSVPSVRIIRIGSRMPCMYPKRVTDRLARMLAKHHPLYMNLHFNHPAELCPEAIAACGRLADAGIPLGAQTVLLRGVNDSAPVLKELFYRLLEARVKPYYLFQIDQTRGTAHFRTSIDAGRALMRKLIGFVSGMAVPRYALDTPGGGGKIPLAPSYVDKLAVDCVFTTYNGTQGRYPNSVWPEEDTWTGDAL